MSGQRNEVGIATDHWQGSRVVGSDAEETVVVILGGSCDVDFPDRGLSWSSLGARADVFDGRSTALYVPVGSRCRVTARDSLAVALVTAPAATERQPYVVRPDDVVVETRGRGSWTRDVHEIVGPDDPADRLLVGETFSGQGVWSSYPPHKHDTDDPPYESKLAEAFYVRISPPSGFGVFIGYRTVDDERRARVVVDGDVLAVNEGFHSFVAAGGHRFYYLWALSGSERVLRFRTDERDAWLLGEGG